MKRIFTLLIFIIALTSFGQNFHFEPTDVLTKTIGSEGMSDLNIDIIRNNTIDTLYLEYELVTNTLPEEWYQGYCDNHGCWGSLPESGYMSPCYEDLNSFIKLSIDPTGIDGSGTVEYYVYETGHYEDGILMTFHIDTPGFVGYKELTNQSISFYPNPAMNYLNLQSDIQISKINIFSLTGQLIESYNSIESRLDISFLQKGLYLINLIDINGNEVTSKLTIK